MNNLKIALSLIDKFYDEHSPEFIDSFFADTNRIESEVVTLDEYLSYFESAYTFESSKDEYLYNELTLIDNNIDELSFCELINLDSDSLVDGNSKFDSYYEPNLAA